MSLEKKIEKIKDDLKKADTEWEARQEQLKTTFNQEYGVYVGRKHTLEDVLKTLLEVDDEGPDEKKEVEPEVIESEEISIETT